MSHHKVALHGLETRTAERFRNLFLINFRGKFSITTEGDQSINIVDADNLGDQLKNLLAELNASNTIVLSDDGNFPDGYNGLQKPTKINQLAEMLDAAAANKLSSSNALTAAKARAATAYSSQTIAISETISTRTDNEDLKTLRQLDSSERYPAQDYFLATFLRAYEAAANSDWVELVNWKNERFILSRRFNLLYCDISKNQLRAIASLPIPQDLQTKSRITPLAALPGAQQLAAMHEQPLERTLWKLAYSTSRGRLPDNLNPSDSYSLEKWPNFTRLPRMKNGMRIAAVWTSACYTPAEVTEQLQVNTAEVNAFLVACHALGLVNTARQSAPVTSRSSRNSSIFHSLLGHLSSAFGGKKTAKVG